MYTPKHFEHNELESVKKFIDEHGFATVVTVGDTGEPIINHIPVVFENDSKEYLVGHMSRHNPQWRSFIKNPKATLLFHGPHSYITPKWYRSGRDVPTWNYTVVHLLGSIELIEKYNDQIRILQQITKHFESFEKTQWLFELPDDLLDPTSLTGAIVSFRFKINKIEAKFKLSQNRSVNDQQGIIQGLNERTDENSQLVRDLMIQNLTNAIGSSNMRDK